MISKLFFAGKVEKLEDTLIYQDDFVIFYLKVQINCLVEFSFYALIVKLIKRLYHNIV